MVVTKLQEVGRKSIASLAFCSAMAQVDGIWDDRFQRPIIFSKKIKLSRGLSEYEPYSFRSIESQNPAGAN